MDYICCILLLKETNNSVRLNIILSGIRSFLLKLSLWEKNKLEKYPSILRHVWRSWQLDWKISDTIFLLHIAMWYLSNIFFLPIFIDIRVLWHLLTYVFLRRAETIVFIGTYLKAERIKRKRWTCEYNMVLFEFEGNGNDVPICLSLLVWVQ